MSRIINVGGVKIGGGSDVSIQSMCNVPTADVERALAQINKLKDAGCDIVRLAVPDNEAADSIKHICERSPLPVVADIHFDWRLAVKCAENGVAKVRINPGNIGSEKGVEMVASACKSRGIPIRIGVNGGSLDKAILAKYGNTPEAMYESAAGNAAILEKCGFGDICISIKSSDVFKTVKAYRLVAKNFDYPLHLGVTEAGTAEQGTIKSAAAFGALLCDGIGDTIRVSLTADPVEEVYAAKKILSALGLNRQGATIVSCPTCGRTRIDLIPLAKKVEQRFSNVRSRITVAVMGCVVNGPGEAREADLGVAGGVGEGVIFVKGEPVKKVSEDMIIEELAAIASQLTGEKI